MATGFNYQARDPHYRLPYQKAVEWIEDFRGKRNRWPTKGSFPEGHMDFSLTTFKAALHDLKVWEGIGKERGRPSGPLPETS